MKYKKQKLGNGLRYITVPMKDNPTVTVLVLVETGSKYETKRLNGISHFLEHMCFKGTDRRPSARAISGELDALGTQYNAFTSQEYTGYYAKGDAKHFKKLFDIVSDIYLHSTFPAAEIEKEKGVIVEEINMYEDMPHRHVGDLLMSLLYGNQPAGWNIAGTRENVRSFTRDDFATYHKNHYMPRSTVVVVAGNIKEKEVEAQVKKAFGAVSNFSKGKKEKTKDIQNKPALLVKDKKTDQSHLILAFRAFAISDPRYPALSVLASLLGGGMSSRLFIKLREELGVAYYVRASADVFTDHGYFEIAAGVSCARTEEVIQEILKECKRIVQDGITQEELAKVKEYMVGNMKLELESSDAFASYFGHQEVLRRPLRKPDEVEKRIRKVTIKAIQNVAKDIFKNEGLNLALIGPFSDTKSLEKVLKI